MTTEDALTASHGARFFRCALHVNTYDYLLRHQKNTGYQSEDSYNDALIDALASNGIEVICVTDHYRIKTSSSLREKGASRGLFVFPGFEAVSKDGIHFLCIFDHGVPDDRIERIIGECGIHDDQDPSPVGSMDALELLEKAPTWGAVLVAAHVSSAGGLLTTLSGQTRMQVWKSPHLLACSLPGTPQDAPQEHKAILLNGDSSYRRASPIAIVNAQDVSDPARVASFSQSCLIKMTKPSIEALRQAFLDQESRIRLLSVPAPAVQFEIASLSWEGGFLDGVALGLSAHMNCLIGGRGTGKSTVVESIRALFSMPPLGNEARKRHEAVLNNVIRPGTRIVADVMVHRPGAAAYRVELIVPGTPIVRTADGSRSNISPAELLPGLEIYGQHEISELANDPMALTGVLSRFLDPADTEEATLRAVRRDLGASQSSLLSVQSRIAELEDRVSVLPKLEEQLKRFEDAGLAVHLKEQAAVINESAELEDVMVALEPLDEIHKGLVSQLPISHEEFSFGALDASPLAADVEVLKRTIIQLNTCEFSIRCHPFSLNSVTPEGLVVSLMLPSGMFCPVTGGQRRCSGCLIVMQYGSWCARS